MARRSETKRHASLDSVGIFFFACVVSLTCSCQCGISRSATLAIAYLMSLAVTGQAPEHLGHLQTMQETYDMVKAKSPCIGPNVSYVKKISLSFDLS